MPIFPELRPYLEAAKAVAKPGEDYVITLAGIVACRGCDRACNLGTQLVKFIKRAGLKPWPKLFHNLRASRQTELAQTFPEHVVCEWIGNSRAVAREHYLRVTEEDYLNAAGSADTAQAHYRGAENAQRKRNTQDTAESRMLAKIVKKACEKGELERLGADLGELVRTCSGAPHWTRTNNPLIKSQMLCQLS